MNTSQIYFFSFKWMLVDKKQVDQESKLLENILKMIKFFQNLGIKGMICIFQLYTNKTTSFDYLKQDQMNSNLWPREKVV